MNKKDKMKKVMWEFKDIGDLFLVGLHNNIREEDMKKYIIIIILILIQFNSKPI